MTPGPIAINAATFVGIRIAGVPGALIATLGSILPSCVIASVLSRVYARYRSVPALQDVLGCLAPGGRRAGGVRPGCRCSGRRSLAARRPR